LDLLDTLTSTIAVAGKHEYRLTLQGTTTGTGQKATAKPITTGRKTYTRCITKRAASVV